jgi:hypothetical protein
MSKKTKSRFFVCCCHIPTLLFCSSFLWEETEKVFEFTMVMCLATAITTSSLPSGGKSCARRVSTEPGEENLRCKSLLPEGFVPTPYSVVCGRGTKCTKAVGNRRLQVIATMFIHKYSMANKKDDKTEIVTEVLKMVKDACPDDRFAFVRYHEGRWWEVETLIAREKIGAVLRDCLHSKYRSSTKSKLERRRAQKRRHRESLPGSEGFSMLTPYGSGIQSNSSIMVVGDCFDNVFN